MKEKVGSQMSNGAIAGSLNLSEIKVAYIISNSRRADGGARKDSRVLRKLLSPRELRGLRRLVEENWLACLWEIAGKLNAGRTDPPAGRSLCSVSPITVQRSVKGMGMRSCTSARKPLVATVTEKKRLQWAKDILFWRVEWASVLSSDESSFLVGQPQSRRVWCRPGQRSGTQDLRPTFKSDRESVPVWEAFSAVVRTPCCAWKGLLTARRT